MHCTSFRLLHGLIPALILGLGAPLVGHAQQPAPATQPTLKEEMRQPWTRSDDRFIRQWQVLGEIPLAASANALAQDPFAASGGEATLNPANAQPVKLADGTPLAWRAVTSWGNAINLSDGKGLKRNLAAYAFATIRRPAAGKARLCLGSDEGLRAWVNGQLVLERNGPRPLTFDEDQIEVDLHAGDNALLLKVEQRTGDWTLAARVLEPGALPPRAQEIAPSFTVDPSATLVIKTDLSPAHASEAPVRVELIAAGGKVAREATAPRGGSVRFATAALADGPYEIRCSTRDMNGRLRTTHLAWFKGDALAAARTLLAAAEKADAASPAGATVKMLGELLLDRLGADGLAATGNPWWAIHSPLMEFAELQLEAAGDAHARARSSGFYRLAWKDDVDGSIQYARVYLPPGYDASKPWPLVVRLHGFNPPNPRYINWWSVDARHSLSDSEYGDGQGVICMEPHGRGNTSYLGFGDADVVRAIRLAQERLNIDADRVYLTGESMGGWGTWNVGTRHPELFAAIAPIFGGVDYHSYLSEEQLAKLTPLTRFLQDKQSSWSTADSLLTMPIFVLHGDADPVVNVDFSRYGVRMLQRWGYNVRYEELPGYVHEDLNRFPQIFDWFLQHRRNAQPRQVRLRSADLRHASAYWATVDMFERPDEFMVVDAEVVAPGTLRIDSQNVLALTLAPGAHLIDPARPVTIVWNGVSRDVSMKEGRISLQRDGLSAPAHPKTRSQNGPIREVFNTPFAIVVGTVSADPAMKAACRRKADELVAFWREWQHQLPRIFLDTEITPSTIAEYSLLLIGGPDDNRIAAALSKKQELPLQVPPDKITLGGRAFATTNARVQLIHPHSQNPDRYVFVVAATSPAALLQWQPATLRNNEYDFLIEDGHVANIDQQADVSELWVAGGWFDRGWSLAEPFLHLGRPDARAKALRLLPSLEPAILEAYTGRYQISPELTLEVRGTGDGLVAHAGTETPVSLLPVGDDRFYVSQGATLVVFERDASGKVASFKSRRNGQDFTGRKVD